MDKRLSQGVVSSGKKVVRQAARQTVHEPLEVVKTAGRQVAGVEVQGAQRPGQSIPETQGPVQPTVEDEQKIRQRGERILEALEAEIEEIRRQKVFKEVQRRITAGEVINLTNIVELSSEQKRMLAVQMQLVQANKQKEEKVKNPLVEPGTKRGRNILEGMKGKVSRLRKKTELRLPPTG